MTISQKGQKNARFVANYWRKRRKIQKILTVAKFQELGETVEECEFDGVNHSDKKPHFTAVQSPRQKGLVTGNEAALEILIFFCECIVCISGIKSYKLFRHFFDNQN